MKSSKMCIRDRAGDVLARVDERGQPFDGYSERNREVPAILHDALIYE